MGEAKRRGSFEERKALAISKGKGIPENVCIICREKKDSNDFNDEHVIPESLKGYYHIRLVCTTCNSEMGSNVDIHLIDHFVSELFRYQHKIKGKKGHIPIPFKETFTHPTLPEITWKHVLDENNNMVLKQNNYVHKDKENCGNLKQVSVSVDPSNESSIDNIVEKIFSRSGIKPEQMIEETKRGIVDPEKPFKSKIKIDGVNFKLGLLKIAYEFTVDNLPEYFFDEIAEKISKILHSADLEKLSEIKMSLGFESELWQSLEPYFDYENRHFIILIPMNNELFCCIKLCDMFSIYIQMSKKPYLEIENSIVGINDFASEQFRITTLIEHIISFTKSIDSESPKN